MEAFRPSHIINGLEVCCKNQRKGCQWKGELKNRSTHLRKEKRNGECQYEEVKCKYTSCRERKQRRYLKYHEGNECPHRPFRCQYCWKDGTYLSITRDHYHNCVAQVHCPNSCTLNAMPHHVLSVHIDYQCPLQPVDCVFSWAGCNDKPLRKDVHEHAADIKHMTLLAAACGQLKEENEQIAEENEKIKEETTNEVQEMMKQVQTLKEENSQLKHHLHQTIPGDAYPLLPIHIRYGLEPGKKFKIAQLEAPDHFYTGSCGRHMSAKIVIGRKSHGPFSTTDLHVLLAFHEGKFDRLQINSKLPKIFADYDGIATPLIKDTEATYVYNYLLIFLIG